MIDCENLIALQAAAHALHTLDPGLPASERSTRVQILGEEVEVRAHRLVEQIRVVRGLAYEEEPTRQPDTDVAPVASAPAPEPEANANGNGHREFNAALVRDVMREFGSGFTMSELIATVMSRAEDANERKIKEFFKIWKNAGHVRDSGFKIGRHPVWEFVKPETVTVNRPKRRPPEMEPPAGLERKATGEPVRVRAMEKLTRKGRSTAGTAHRHRMRDKKFEQMDAAKRARAEQQRLKALRDQNTAAASAARVKKKGRK